MKQEKSKKSLTKSNEWKTRRSELEGYNRTYYVNTAEEDYLRADVSKNGDTVRLYAELGADGGVGYVSIIRNGKIAEEKSALSQKSGDFSEKFASKADVFSMMPSSSLIKLIAGNYGISSKKVLTAKRLEETKAKYFKNKQGDNSDKEIAEVGSRNKVQFSFIDLIDFGIGIMAALIVFLVFDNSFTILGIVLSMFGITIGAIDMFIRNKEIVISKMLVFILAGMGSYIYGYFGIYF